MRDYIYATMSPLRDILGGHCYFAVSPERDIWGGEYISFLQKYTPPPPSRPGEGDIWVDGI